MTLNGSVYRAGFMSSQTTAATVNITGTAGDCLIKGISLVGHKHKEQQSGDVVYPGVATSPPV